MDQETFARWYRLREKLLFACAPQDGVTLEDVQTAERALRMEPLEQAKVDYGGKK